MAFSSAFPLLSKSYRICSQFLPFACTFRRFLQSEEAFQKIPSLFRTSFHSLLIPGRSFRCGFHWNSSDNGIPQCFLQRFSQRIINLLNKELFCFFLVQVAPIGIHRCNDKLAHGSSAAAQNLVGSPGLRLVEIQAELDIANVFSHCADDIPSGIRSPWQWRKCHHRR